MKNKIIMFSILAIIIFCIFRISVFREAALLIIISFITAYAFKPLFQKLIKLGINKRISALLIIFLIVIFFALILAVLIPSIIKEASNFTSTLDSIQSIVNYYYNKFKLLSTGTLKNLVYSLNDNITRKVQIAVTASLEKVMNIGEEFLSLSVIPIIVYYFLADGERINNRMVILFPIKTRNIVKRIGKDIDKTLNRYIISQFILSIFMSVLTFIVLVVLKVNFPLTLALINGVFNVIPYFGPILGGVPAILMALLKSPKTALWTMIFIFIIQQIEGNIISPKITGDSVNMHPLLVILLIIIGAKIAGFWGMLLAIPIGVIIKIIYDDIIYYMY